MRTITAVSVTRTPSQVESEMGLGRNIREYQQEFTEAYDGLVRTTGLSEEACRSMAYLIISETIPEMPTYKAFDALTRRQEVELGGHAMRMLDGNKGPQRGLTPEATSVKMVPKLPETVTG